MKKLRIAITGATGLLGRNLLFEILKQQRNNLGSLEIFVLGRRSPGKSLRERIDEIINDDGRGYCGFTDSRESLESVRAMEMDLVEDKLRLSQEDYKELKSSLIDFFFHIAALTDFRSSEAVTEALYKTNVYGTKQILQLASNLNVKEFSYVGSAYSCGKASGDILPNQIDLRRQFRNPYEKTKAEAELLVREFSKTTNTKCRYFRPSTICG
ncbi:MAG: SDR family oxidoreductase, partial [Candidatus Omnitrophica bacterium]|nr:SDR family oxidoreductase [Candidatus Omnitrophota bacterium]